MRMPRGDSGSESLIASTTRRLSRIRIPFKAPSLLDRSAPYFSGIKRFGISKFQHYFQVGKVYSTCALGGGANAHGDRRERCSPRA